MFSIRRLCYLLLITCTAIAVHVIFFNAQSHWVVYSAFGLASIPFSRSFALRVNTACLSGFLLVTSIFIASNLGPYPWVALLFLTALTISAVYISAKKPAIFFAALIIVLFSVLAWMTFSTLQESITRTLYVSIGVLIVLLAQCVFAPFYFRSELYDGLCDILQAMSRLNAAIFDCYLNDHYQQAIYLFESRIHKQKKSTLIALRQCERMFSLNTSHSNNIYLLLNVLFDLILDQGQLRFRVIDQATFHLCRKEMLVLAEEFENIFSELATGLQRKKHYLNIAGLNEKIKRLDENYQHVLKVAAADPLVFLLFIHSLKELSTHIEMLYTTLLDRKTKREIKHV